MINMPDYPDKSKHWQFIYTVGLAILGVIFVLGIAPGIASASPTKLETKTSFSALALQTFPTVTPILQPTSVYTFALDTLGYEEISLISPYGQAQYSFSLPQNWIIQSDGILNLDLSYSYYQASTDYPTLFGNVAVKLDGQTLHTFSIDTKTLEHYQGRLSLPLAMLANPNQTRHQLEIIFDAGFLCNIPHKAKLVIHPTSFISLNYTQRPLSLNLVNYPQPFYQSAFEPNNVYFVLPSSLTASDLSSALAIAAKLGNLTNNQLVISATTDLNLSQALSTTTATFDKHLILVGRPQDNRLLPLLNKKVGLPVSLRQRQLSLEMQGPAMIAPGDTFTYVLTVTNTTTQTVEPLLVNSLPAYVEFIKCAPDCTQNNISQTITLKSAALAPHKSLNLSLTLQATDTLTGITSVENTVTLVDANTLNPLNAATFTTTLTTGSTEQKMRLFTTQEGDYFFEYNGLAVAAGDGIIQEIASPWGKNQAVLIVTGLSDEAVRKASQAMSSNSRLPGLSGSVALVKDIIPALVVNDQASLNAEMTFADQGYPDQVLRGSGSTGRLDYFFPIPYGWSLTDQAYIDLYFNHSQLINHTNSSLTVLLRGEPVASIPLNEKTATNGYIRVNLGEGQFQGGQIIQLALEVNMAMPDTCANPSEFWFLAKGNSKISMAHQENTNLTLDLSRFPYPFHLNPTLADLLFALPDPPLVDEWVMALRLAASLGKSSKGSIMTPLAILGDNYSPEILANYHVLAIGRPSRNSLIQKVNDQLPQPFLPSSDEIKQYLNNVILRLPPSMDLGYLQLIPSPWNNARAFIAVTGTTDKSITWTTDVLTRHLWDLKNGNLALIKVNQVTTIDTRQLTRSGVAMAIATSVPGITPTVTAVTTITPTVVVTPSPPHPTLTPTKTQSTPVTERPGWLIPLIGATAVMVIAIFAFAFWQTRKRRTL
jgi:hypothetical protein